MHYYSPSLLLLLSLLLAISSDVGDVGDVGNVGNVVNGANVGDVTNVDLQIFAMYDRHIAMPGTRIYHPPPASNYCIAMGKSTLSGCHC